MGMGPTYRLMLFLYFVLIHSAVPLRRNRSIRGVPPSVNGTVHSLSVPHIHEWTGSLAECTQRVPKVGRASKNAEILHCHPTNREKF